MTNSPMRFEPDVTGLANALRATDFDPARVLAQVVAMYAVSRDSADLVDELGTLLNAVAEAARTSRPGRGRPGECRVLLCRRWQGLRPVRLRGRVRGRRVVLPNSN